MFFDHGYGHQMWVQQQRQREQARRQQQDAQLRRQSMEAAQQWAKQNPPDHKRMLAEQEAKARLQREKEEQGRLHRELQQRFELPIGSAVRIKEPCSKIHGVVGVLRRLEWRRNTLWAFVEIDPLPQNHPLQRGLARNRPMELMPQWHEIKAEMMTRSHPEMVGETIHDPWDDSLS